MTIVELYNHLKDIGLPLAYSHFSDTPDNPHPNPPYLVYLFSYSNDLIADNVNYKEISNFQIELYTNKKDLASEKAVEDKLKEIELPYSKLETWIDTEQVYQILYEVQLI